MKKYTEIEDSAEVMERLFGKRLEVCDRNNYFSYSAMDYENTYPNRIRIGLSYKTQSGKNSKIYEYANLVVYKNTEISSEKVEKLLKDKLEYLLRKDVIEEWLFSWGANKFKGRQSLTNIIVSTGTGSTEMYTADTISLKTRKDK